MNMYQGFSASAVAGSSTISSMRWWMRIMWSMFSFSWRRIFSSRESGGELGLAFAASISRPRMCFIRRACCQPGFSRAAQSGSVGRSPRMSMPEGVRWKT